jgi:hypothetical protein
MEPGLLNERGYSLIVKVGNWYERMAQRLVDNAADRSILETRGLINQAKVFWKELQKAQSTLDEEKSSRFNFHEQIAAWPTLASLCG